MFDEFTVAFALPDEFVVELGTIVTDPVVFVLFVEGVLFVVVFPDPEDVVFDVELDRFVDVELVWLFVELVEFSIGWLTW